MAASTSHAYPGPSHIRKRSNPGGEDHDSPIAKSSREQVIYHYVLESESDLPTDEDTESIHSIQDKPTDSAKDTSDLPWTSGDENIVLTIGETRPSIQTVDEYEPVSFSEHESLVPDILSTASDSDHAKVDADINFKIKFWSGVEEDSWADTSSISSDSERDIDPELSLRDYWSCVQCKATNNNPLFRYCEKCFKVRKNFFPPRPKAKNKKKKRKPRRRSFSKRNLEAGDKVVGVADSLENVGVVMPLGSSNSCKDNLVETVSRSVCSPLGSGSAAVCKEDGKDKQEFESQSTMILSNSLDNNTSQEMNDTNNKDSGLFSLGDCDGNGSRTSSLNVSSENQIEVSNDVNSNFVINSSVNLSDNNENSVVCCTPLNKPDLKPRSELGTVGDRLSDDIVVNPGSHVSGFDMGKGCDNKFKTNKEGEDKGTALAAHSNITPPSWLCETCMSRPKDSVFVHGRKFGHMYCCYQCSKKVWRNTRRCPLCNCKVNQVLKVVW